MFRVSPKTHFYKLLSKMAESLMRGVYFGPEEIDPPSEEEDSSNAVYFDSSIRKIHINAEKENEFNYFKIQEWEGIRSILANARKQLKCTGENCKELTHKKIADVSTGGDKAEYYCNDCFRIFDNRFGSTNLVIGEELDKLYEALLGLKEYQKAHYNSLAYSESIIGESRGKSRTEYKDAFEMCQKLQEEIIGYCDQGFQKLLKNLKRIHSKIAFIKKKIDDQVEKIGEQVAYKLSEIIIPKDNKIYDKDGCLATKIFYTKLGLESETEKYEKKLEKSAQDQFEKEQKDEGAAKHLINKHTPYCYEYHDQFFKREEDFGTDALKYIQFGAQGRSNFLQEHHLVQIDFGKLRSKFPDHFLQVKLPVLRGLTIMGVEKFESEVAFAHKIKVFFKKIMPDFLDILDLRGSVYKNAEFIDHNVDQL